MADPSSWTYDEPLKTVWLDQSVLWRSRWVSNIRYPWGTGDAYCGICSVRIIPWWIIKTYHLSHVTTWRSHQIPGVHTFCRGTLTHAQFVSGCCPIRFRTHIEALSSNGDILWETTVQLSWIWKTNQSQIQINEWSQIEFDTGKGPRVIESKSIINPPNCKHIHQKHR